MPRMIFVQNVIVGLMFCLPAAAQSAPGGVSDLNGVWTNESLTNLNRPAGVDKLVLSAEEAQQVIAGTSIAGFSLYAALICQSFTNVPYCVFQIRDSCEFL